MSNSNDSERSAPDHEPRRKPRFDSVTRWVEYIRAQPPEVWGPQQNAVVNGQLDSAQQLDRTVEQERRIREFADRVLAEESASDGQASREE